MVCTIPLQSFRVAVKAMFPTLRAGAGLVLVADDVVHHRNLASQEAPCPQTTVNHSPLGTQAHRCQPATAE